MYYLSKLTGNYYNSEFVGVPKDDSNQSYLDMIADGNIEIVESFEFEIEAMNAPKVPSQLSRMKFEIQLYITTTVRDENNNILQFGKTFQDIIDYIDSLQMSNFYKNLLKMRLLSCVTLERDNDDLNALAPEMGISQAQLDEIFINGNSLS